MSATVQQMCKRERMTDRCGMWWCSNPNKDAFDFEDRVREVTISCPDATGLGVDITRVLLDFGLRIVHADMITDCSWCFLVLTLKLIDLGVPARWKLLKRRLEGSCPKDVDALYQLSGGMIDRNSDCEPYIVTVTGQDREGMLHVLMNSFWEADCAVFRAKIETHEGGIVQDMFWIYDNKKKLPSEDRVMEVSDRVVGVLGGDVECSIARAPAHEVVAPRNIIAAVSGLYGEEPMRRLACKDAVSHSNLRELISGEKKHARRGSSSDSLSSFDTHSPGSFPSFGRLSHFLTSKIRLEEFSKYQDVVVDVDTETSSDFIILEVKCQDRKGLLYDIFLQLKEIRVRVAACRMNLMEDKRARVVVTLQDAYGGDMCSSSQAIPLLVQRLKEAVASPLQILLADGSNPRQALLSIVAPVDAGGRGRPRVTFDVTRVLTSAGLMISEADGKLHAVLFAVYCIKLDGTLAINHLNVCENMCSVH